MLRGVALPVLFQLMASHRCEAARWALDYKAQPYVVRSLLPGPHIAQLVALTRQSQVPALLIDGRVLVGTRTIMVELERRDATRPLSNSPGHLEAQLAAVDRLEADLADPLESVWLAAVLTEPEYAAALFALGRGPTRRRLYHAMFPAIRAGLAVRFRLNDAAHIAQQRSRVTDGLDRIAADTGPGRMLAGDGLNAAVIGAAGLLSFFVPPPWCPYRLQDQLPDAVAALRADLQGHPAVQWATDVYRRHRGVSMAENHEIEGSGVI